MNTFEFIEGEPDAAELAQQSERRRRLLETSDERVNRLSARITELEAQLQLLRKSEEGTLAQMAETNERFEAALSGKRELEARLAEAEVKVKASDADIKFYVRKLEQAEASSQEWQTLCEQSIELGKQAEARVNGLWAEIDSHRAHVKHLEDSRDVYEKRAEKAEARAEAAEKEVEHLGQLVTEHDGIECTKHDILVRLAIEERKRAQADAGQLRVLLEKTVPVFAHWPGAPVGLPELQAEIEAALSPTEKAESEGGTGVGSIELLEARLKYYEAGRDELWKSTIEQCAKVAAKYFDSGEIVDEIRALAALSPVEQAEPIVSMEGGQGVR